MPMMKEGGRTHPGGERGDKTGGRGGWEASSPTTPQTAPALPAEMQMELLLAHHHHLVGCKGGTRSGGCLGPPNPPLKAQNYIHLIPGAPQPPAQGFGAQCNPTEVGTRLFSSTGVSQGDQEERPRAGSPPPGTLLLSTVGQGGFSCVGGNKAGWSRHHPGAEHGDGTPPGGVPGDTAPGPQGVPGRLPRLNTAPNPHLGWEPTVPSPSGAPAVPGNPQWSIPALSQPPDRDPRRVGPPPPERRTPPGRDPRFGPTVRRPRMRTWRRRSGAGGRGKQRNKPPAVPGAGPPPLHRRPHVTTTPPARSHWLRRAEGAGLRGRAGALGGGESPFMKTEGRAAATWWARV